MTGKTLIPVDRAPGFNRAAADVVYKAMTSMDDDAALVFGRLLVAEANHYDEMAHYGEFAKMRSAQAADRAGKLSQAYARRAVAKARRGQDNTDEIATLVAIGKAFDFTSDQLSRWASQRQRDASGRFTAEHQRIHTDETSAPASPRQAHRRDGAPVASHLKGSDQAHYQQAYQQIRDMLLPYKSNDLNAQLKLHVEGRKGDDRTETIGVKNGKPEPFPHKIHSGDRITSAEVTVNPTESNAGGVFTAGNALHAPRTAARAASMYDAGTSTVDLKALNAARGKPDENEPHSAATRAFGRVQRGSKFLQDSMGDVLPRNANMALSVANHIGQFGPEAQKILGPSADRIAYRYRGTERAPAPELRRAVSEVARDGEFASPGAKRSYLVDGVKRPGESWDPGPLLDYFRDELPDPDLNELQRRSGVIPPSEGVIIDRDGHIAAQSSGFADDWYLPFNLKHLAALKGGQYVRTRTFGGPTTEDIYTGLVSGARSMTVVSHNGVYTVKFDRNLRGGRRFNDKAARMVGRYGHLLDALRSKQIRRGGISPQRMAELRDEAENTGGGLEPGSPEFKEELNQLKAREERNPKLSEAEKDDAAVEWLGDVASKVKTKDGRTMTPDELVAQVVTARGNDQYAAARRELGAGSLSRAQFIQAAGQRIASDDPTQAVANVAAMMGMTDSFDRHMKQAERANRERVKSLDLNGPGYKAALDALKEQFPYYIDSVTYHPWRASMGSGDEQMLSGRADTGYVLPNHNRPRAAEAGFFDPDVTGHGKVRADTTRFQNFRVHQGHPVSVGEKTESADKVKGADEAKTSSRKEEAQGKLRNIADRAMLDDIFSQDKFQQGASVSANGRTASIGGQDVSAMVKDSAFPSDNPIKRLYEVGKPELERQLADPEEAKQVRDLMQRVVDSKMLKLDSVKVRAFKNDGKVKESTKLPSDTGDMLREIDDDHDIPGAAFSASAGPSEETVADTYKSNAFIKPLVASGVLPESVSADGFDDALRKATETVGMANDHIVSADARSIRVDPSMRRRVGEQAKGLAYAAQLRRRYKEALDMRALSTPPPSEPAPVERQNTMVITPDALKQMAEGGTISADDLERMLRNVRDKNDDDKHKVIDV